MVEIEKSIDEWGYLTTGDVNSFSARIWAMPVDSTREKFNLFYMENRILRNSVIYVKVFENVSHLTVDSHMLDILNDKITKGKRPRAYEIAEGSV